MSVALIICLVLCCFLSRLHMLIVALHRFYTGIRTLLSTVMCFFRHRMSRRQLDITAALVASVFTSLLKIFESHDLFDRLVACIVLGF
jgi:hypothetical protein